MIVERISAQDGRLSRREVLKAAAGLALAVGSRPDALSAQTEEDPYTERYEAFLADINEGMQSPEGRVNAKYSIEETGDIIYGYAREIASELDQIDVGLAREDFVLTAKDNRLIGSGELSANAVGVSGDIKFHIELTSNPDGRLGLDKDTLEVDGPFALDLLDPEGAVEDKVGDNPNAVFVEYLNKALQKRFEDDTRVGDAGVFITDEFVELEIVREVRS